MLVTKEVKEAINYVIEVLEREKAIVDHKYNDLLNVKGSMNILLEQEAWLKGKQAGLKVAIDQLKSV